MKKTSFLIYTALILLSLIVVFFVGRNDAGALMFTTDGLGGFKQGMDIAGGVRLNYKIDLQKYEELYPDPQEYAAVTRNVQNIILQNIDGRISALGVSDYTSYIQSLEDGQYLVIELGGVQNLEEAKAIIGKTVELEFKTLYQGDGSDVYDQRVSRAEAILTEAVATPDRFGGLVNGSDEADNIFYSSYRDATLEELPEIYRDTPALLAQRSQAVYASVVEGIYETSGSNELKGRVISKLTAVTPQQIGTGTTQTVYSIEDIFIQDTPERVIAQDPETREVLNGAYFKFAGVSQSQTGQPVASITFDETGKNIFCNITEIIVGEPMAIFVGGELVTSPVIREKICGGSAQIDGDFDVVGARKLVDDLNEGALPAALLLANEEKVSPTLGEQALQGAIIAGGIGLVLVFVYMTFSYGMRYGLISLIALGGFLLILFALVKLIGYALSLSGIAAILLSIGMGVDANILIYERVREEEEHGSAGDEAIRIGYEKSWSAIKDGNMTTLMIAVILFFIGTNVFKGFGTMMIINILLTLMVLVPYTKELLYRIQSKK